MKSENLVELGLSKREAKAYLSLLELGSTTVSHIVRKTGIPSSKIYEVLERLQKKGLVSYVLIRGVRHYQASDPKIILQHLDERREKIRKVLPMLIAKQKLAEKQSVELYEGQKAVFTMFANLIRDGRRKELYLIFSIGEEFKNPKIHRFFKILSLRRKVRGLDVRLLRTEKNRPKWKKRHRKVKIRYTKFDFPQGITIFRDTVIILAWEEIPYAIRIDSKIFADQFRNFFLQLWKSVKQ